MANIRFYLHLLVLVVVCITTSCKNNKHNDLIVEFTYFHSDVKEVQIYDNIVYTLILHEIDDCITFDYQNEKEVHTFCINFSKLNGYRVQSKDTIQLLYEENIRFIDNPTDTIEIFKFVTMSHAIDGDSYYYISPKYGVILGMSTTWPNFFVLSKHHWDKDVIHHITSALLYNRHYINYKYL